MLINLLSHRNKSYVGRVYQTHRLIAWGLVINLLLLSAIVLTVIFARLAAEQKKTLEASVVKLQADTDVISFNQSRDRLNELAAFLVVINSLGQATATPTDRLAQIIAVKPSGVRLSAIDYQISEGIGSLRGVFAVRKDLLDFVDRLEDLPQVATVDSPVSNIVSETNGYFSITLTYEKPK